MIKRIEGIARRTFCAVLSVVLLLSMLAVPAAADELNQTPEEHLIITGTLDQKFSLNSNTSRLFALEDVVPGDTWNGRIQIKNGTRRTMEAGVTSIINNLPDDPLLFNTLTLCLKYDGEILYSGSYGGAETPVTKYIPVPAKQSVYLDVEVTLPITAGNEVLAKSMDSTWVIDARIPSSITVITTDPEPDSEPDPGVKTGHDLSTSSSTAQASLIILLLALLCAVVIYLRYKSAVTEYKKRQEKEER